jgi:hypothetical protein
MKRYWVVGGEYEDAAFRRLVPGTEKLAGPFADERRARDEWVRLTYSPGTAAATTQYSIVADGASR